MRQLIAGNWKMHTLGQEARALAQAVAEGAQALPADVLVCPPFVHVASVAAALAGTKVAVGGQDCHEAVQGAHTGDVAAPMLRDVGATHVILGHSERRQNHAETDAQVRAKTLAATAAGLTPIVCVGETESERNAGREQAVVAGQLAGSLPEGFAGVVAYEPVWAIGTGKTATTQQAQDVHAFIRGVLTQMFDETTARRVRIQYGGSVKPGNARELMSQPDVDGALVGGAALTVRDFADIIKNSI